MKSKRRVRRFAPLDMAPLIDIVFLLLVFFMLTANFILIPGVEIKLPESTSRTFEEIENIIITIDASEAIYINDEHITIDMIEDTIAELLADQGKTKVVIKCDADNRYGLAVHVMDAAKAGGAESLILATELPE